MTTIISTPPATQMPVPPDRASPETCVVVLSVMADAADASGLITTSIRGLASSCGVSRETIRRAVRQLLDAGSLGVVRAGTGAGYPTRYRLTRA